jgi:hypothetical protein
MSTTPEGKYLLYHYHPSLAAAVIFIVLFAISSVGHIFQLFTRKTWYFIPFVIGGLFETIGYVGRALNSQQDYAEWTLGPYVMQSLLILLAPALFAASIYMILSRIILLTDGEKHSPIRAKWLTKVFVAGDVLSFLMQSSGGGMLATAKTEASTKTGNNIITGGLAVQVIFFGFFIFTASIFHYRITRADRGRHTAVSVPWQQYLVILYIASTLIMIRSIFRIIEYGQGNSGYLLSTEVFIYVFDATLMFLVMVLFNLRHPSAIINNESMAEHYAAPDSYSSDVAMETVPSGRKKHSRTRTRESV